MEYEETISWLYRHLPMFSRIGTAAYKKDLHNITELCNRLENPQQHLKSIHVAGTNGKGSVCNMLAAILQKSGYKVGLYTSPHLRDFRERIRIDGQMIDKEFIVNFVERMRSITEEIQPSFFELTVAMAFEYFHTQKTDIAIIETGLGGRLDSTNIITPVLSVITNIGLDHTNLLGNTLEEIAFEKAGIIKKNIPAVIGETLPETLPVFVKKANEQNAELHLANSEFEVEYLDASGDLLLCNIKDTRTHVVEKLRLELTGHYQSKNLCTVLSSVEVLKKCGFNIAESDLHQALESVQSLTGFEGRWQVLQSKPALIVDVAHNEDGIKQVIAQLQVNYSNAHYHFILGFVNDKDISSLLQLFPPQSNFYFTNAHIPRALPAPVLQKLAGQYLLEGDIYDDVNDAVKAALKNAMPHDAIIVCGSFFIIAELEHYKE